MRKLALVLITIFALSLFTAFAVAQTPGGTTGTNQTSQGSSATPDSNTSSAPVSGSATDPAMVNGDQNRAAKSSNEDMSAGEKTLDGCVVKEQSDYFIQPASGERERLMGSQDFSSHVGHEVKVHGTDQMATASNSAASDRTSTSGSASAESQNNAAGSIAGNAGSSNASGTGAASSNNMAGSNWSGKDFMVTKVDMVSTSCPADIQKKVDENKK